LVAARMRTWFEIPYGYQDETGFHYGQPPRPPVTPAKVLTDQASNALLCPATGVSAAETAPTKSGPAAEVPLPEL
jgi:hypothetical protein